MTRDALKAYRAVLLDIDDTVYDYRAAHACALGTVYDETPAISGALTRRDFETRYRAHRTRVTEKHGGSGASRSRALAFQALFEEIGTPQAYAHAGDAEELYWTRLIDAMEPNAELIDMLDSFAATGRPICAVTDMQARWQLAKLRKLKIDTIVTHMVTSEEIGVEKPDPALFHAALDKVNAKAAEVVMIGDNPDKDIAGAEQLGIEAWQIRDGALHRPSS